MTVNFSVVVPHYNDMNRLERLLRSVPVMRHDIEVIVVDDCTPGSAEIDIIRSRWPMVNWLTTPRNSGAGVARNIGLESARGRWLLFADSDDEFLPDAFNIFDSSLKDDDQLVYFLADAIQEVDGTPSVRSEKMNELVVEYVKSPNSTSFERLRLQHVNPVAKVYSRLFIESIGIRFDSMRQGEDVVFNVFAAMQAIKVRAVAVSVYRIYRRAGSLTGDVTASAFMERLLADLTLADRLQECGIKDGRDATGYMLSSFKYGPKIVLRVWRLAIFSPLRIEWIRIFNLGRWRRFIKNQRRDAKERAK